jgi:hypothetical protein
VRGRKARCATVTFARHDRHREEQNSFGRTSVYSAPGRLDPGNQVEFRASGGVITITAKPPAADDEYTPEQRRNIDAQLG